MTDGRIDPPTAAFGMPRLRMETEIRALTVDILRPLTGPISLVEYDPGWAGLFARGCRADRRPGRDRRTAPVDTALTPRPAGRTVRDTQMNDLFYFRSPA
jgi:hypothetical protein